MAGAAVDAMQALLVEAVRLRESEAELHRQLAETRDALDRSYLRPSYRLREKLVRVMENGRVGRGMLAVYRRLRGRNSRSA